MSQSLSQRPVLADVFATEGAALWVKRVALIVVGVAARAIAAKIKVPMWPSPVPITLGTLAVLSIGAAYGPRLGAATLVAYLLIGALGFDVFASSSAEKNGLAYMLGGTGGYLAGYLLAVVALGYAARKGWDRNILTMAAAMFAGNVLIYAIGVPWLHYVIESGGLYNAANFTSIWDQTLSWGLTPYLIGDAMKLALAALLFPLIWRAVGSART